MKTFRFMICVFAVSTLAILPLEAMNNQLSLKKKIRNRVRSLLRSHIAEMPPPTTVETKFKFPIPKHLIHLHRHFISELDIPTEVNLLIIRDLMRLQGHDWIYTELLEAVRNNKSDLYALAQSFKYFCDTYGIDTCTELLKKCLQELGLTLYEMRGKKFGSTVMHYAAYGNYTEVVRLLLNVMDTDAYLLASIPSLKGGQTPLHVAAIGGRSNIAGLLLAAAPNREAVRDMINTVDEGGKSALDVATEMGKEEMIDLLKLYRDKDIGDDELNELLNSFNNDCKIFK